MPEQLAFLETYERRCVLFMDILGFRSLIDSGNEDKILRILHRATQLAFNPPDELKGIAVTSFSDSIVISAPMSNMAAIDQVCSVGTQLVLEFIDESIMTRGAITIGKLHHDGAIVFGPALNAAYDYENSLANYPRVVISEEVVAEDARLQDVLFKAIVADKFLPSRVGNVIFRRDFDGIHHLNIFTPLFAPNAPALIARKQRTTDDYNKAIMKIMENKPRPQPDRTPSAKELNIVSKYEWLMTYYESAMLHNRELLKDFWPD